MATESVRIATVKPESAAGLSAVALAKIGGFFQYSLQVRLNATMQAKGRKWYHGLGNPITEITKHGVRLTPPNLQLILLWETESLAS